MQKSHEEILRQMAELYQTIYHNEKEFCFAGGRTKQELLKDLENATRELRWELDLDRMIREDLEIMFEQLSDEGVEALSRLIGWFDPSEGHEAWKQITAAWMDIAEADVVPLENQPDPELERLLAEEAEIDRKAKQAEQEEIDALPEIQMGEGFTGFTLIPGEDVFLNVAPTGNYHPRWFIIGDRGSVHGLNVKIYGDDYWIPVYEMSEDIRKHLDIYPGKVQGQE